MFSGGMALSAFDVDVFIGNCAGTMASIVANMFTRPLFHVIRNACMTKPVHRGFSYGSGIIGKTIGTHALDRIIKTRLYNFSDERSVRDRPMALNFRKEGRLIG